MPADDGAAPGRGGSKVAAVQHSLTATMLGSALAGVVARIPVHPLDTCKAKMQVELRTPYVNLYDALKRTWGREGVRGLYSGIGIAVVGSAPAACLYFTSFEAAKRMFAASPVARDHPMKSHFVAGLLAETVSCALWVPIDVVKERLQVQSNDRSHGAPRYRGSWDALRGVARSEGLRGVYKGYGATVSSFGPFSAFYLMFYERLKLWSLERRAGDGATAELSTAANLVNGAVAGGLAAFLTSPLDMAKLRIQVQRGRAAAGVPAQSFDFNYRNVFHGVAEIARRDGVRGLWRGATARVAFMSPATAITIAAYEKCTSVSASLLSLL